MLALCSGCAKPTPQSYEDCVLLHVTGGQTTAATNAILSACKKKFPPKAAPGLFDDLIPPKP